MAEVTMVRMEGSPSVGISIDRSLLLSSILEVRR